MTFLRGIAFVAFALVVAAVLMAAARPVAAVVWLGGCLAAVSAFHLYHLQGLNRWSILPRQRQLPIGFGTLAGHPRPARPFRAPGSRGARGDRDRTRTAARRRRPAAGCAGGDGPLQPGAVVQPSRRGSARHRRDAPADRPFHPPAGVHPLPGSRRLPRAAATVAAAPPRAHLFAAAGADTGFLAPAGHPRCHGAEQARCDAPRLRRQRLARDPHAAHGGQRLHRNPDRPRPPARGDAHAPQRGPQAGGDHAEAARGPADAFVPGECRQPAGGPGVRHRAAAARVARRLRARFPPAATPSSCSSTSRCACAACPPRSKARCATC